MMWLLTTLFIRVVALETAIAQTTLLLKALDANRIHLEMLSNLLKLVKQFHWPLGLF